MIELAISLSSFGFLLLGLLVGRLLEQRHFAHIRKREAAYLNKPAVTFAKTYPLERKVNRVALAAGSVVVSIDYFKRFLASWRMLFGGEVKSYASIIDRGRREALLRMKETHPQADAYINCRMETSSISKGGRKRKVGCAEVLAYCTAVYYE